MTRFKHLTLAAALALAVGLGVLLQADRGLADTNTPAVATPGVVVLPVHLSGQYTADVTGVATIKLPFAGQVLGVSATARASGGTSPTLTIDVLDDGVSLLSAPVSVTAGAVAEATLATTTIADESEISIDLGIGGTSPTWDDIDVLITLVRN